MTIRSLDVRSFVSLDPTRFRWVSWDDVVVGFCFPNNSCLFTDVSLFWFPLVYSVYHFEYITCLWFSAVVSYFPLFSTSSSKKTISYIRDLILCSSKKFLWNSRLLPYFWFFTHNTRFYLPLFTCFYPKSTLDSGTKMYG